MSSLLPILTLLVTTVFAQLQVTTSPSPVSAEVGSTAVLQCKFTLGVTPVDPAQVHVVWKNEGKKVLSYVDQITAFRPGAQITEEHLAQGDASLSLPNVTHEDAGWYSCSIRLASEQATQSLNLIVKDYRYIKVEGTTVIVNQSNELSCSASNLSSPDVTFEWVKNGKVLSTSIPLVVEGSDSDGFRVQNSFCFTPVLGDDSARYACQIKQENVPYPLKKTFQLTFGARPQVTFYLSSKGQRNSSLVCLVSGFYPDDLSLAMKRDGQPLGYKLNKWLNGNGTYSLEATYRSNVSYSDNNVDYTCTVYHPTVPGGTTERLRFLVDAYVPIGLWIAAISGLLLAVLFQIFCKYVTDISGCKDWTDGSIAVLKCHISGRYPRSITAVWFIRRGDKETEVKEKGSLYTAGNYRELQEQDSYTCWNVVKKKFVGGIRHSLCSILCFKVHKEKHDQAEFICRFMRGGKVLKEKKYYGTVLDNYGFYSVSKVCIPDVCNEGEKLTLCCTMKGNVPRDIRVTWEKSFNEERTGIEKDQDTNYQVTENISSGQICSFLTFCPTCEDSGAIFTCSITDNEGRILGERSSQPLKVAEPKKTSWSRTYRDWGFRAFDESVTSEM
ncbi:tyrosine-protein phosphatase non-receptor type substrate 1-like isoform X1 [Lithobates pipiens]